jgi:hypothetical protein
MWKTLEFPPQRKLKIAQCFLSRQYCYSCSMKEVEVWGYMKRVTCMEERCKGQDVFTVKAVERCLWKTRYKARIILRRF